MSLRILRSLILGAGFLGASSAFGWGDVGHMSVCQVAYGSLTETTKEALKELIGNRNFARQCIWPDQVKKMTQVPRGQTADPKKVDWSATAGYHFINYELGDHWASANPVQLPATKDAQGKVVPAPAPLSFAQGGDMLQEIIIAKDAITDKKRTKEQRLCHLRFFGHLAGDSHQPLHVGHASDRGGNLTSAPLFGLKAYRFKAQQLVDGREANCTENGDDEIESGCTVTKKIDPTVPDPIITDKGECGGCVNVVTFTDIPTSAHGVWDDGFIELRVRQLIRSRKIVVKPENSEIPNDVFPPYSEFVANQALGSRDRKAVRLWMWDDILRWTELSGMRREYAYDMSKVPKTGPEPKDPRLADEVTDERAAAAGKDPWFMEHVAVVEDRIVRAGMHLAGQLNRMFDPEFRAASVKEFGEAEVAAREAAGKLREQEILDRIAARRKAPFVSECDKI